MQNSSKKMGSTAAAVPLVAGQSTPLTSITREGERISLDVFCGSLRLQTSYGYAGDRNGGGVSVRRVKTADRGEHIQIAVEAWHATEKRTNTQHCSFSVPPEMIPALVTALTKLHPPHDSSKRLTYREERAAECEFYGISDPDAQARAKIAARVASKATA